MSFSVPFWITKVGQLWRLVRESHQKPMAGAHSIPAPVALTEAAITFIGHSSFLIRFGDRALLVDPVFATRLILLRRQRRPGVLVRDLPPIDAVLLTHAHMDHLNLASLRAVIRQMRRRGARPPAAVVPEGVEDLVHSLGFREICSLAWWESTVLEGITITSTPAKHWGARMFRDRNRGYGGYAIAVENMPTFYHSGDTAYFPGFREIGRRLVPDVALLPIGAYFPDSYRAVHTSPEEAVRAFLDLGAQAMVPMHYNTFRLGREPMSEPLVRLSSAAAREHIEHRVFPLTEGETWLAPRSMQRREVGEA